MQTDREQAIQKAMRDCIFEVARITDSTVTSNGGDYSLEYRDEKGTLMSVRIDHEVSMWDEEEDEQL